VCQPFQRSVRHVHARGTWGGTGGLLFFAVCPTPWAQMPLHNPSSPVSSCPALLLNFSPNTCKSPFCMRADVLESFLLSPSLSHPHPHSAPSAHGGRPEPSLSYSPLGGSPPSPPPSHSLSLSPTHSLTHSILTRLPSHPRAHSAPSGSTTPLPFVPPAARRTSLSSPSFACSVAHVIALRLALFSLAR